jgi:hypothetical protein
VWAKEEVEVMEQAKVTITGAEEPPAFNRGRGNAPGAMVTLTLTPTPTLILTLTPILDPNPNQP